MSPLWSILGRGGRKKNRCPLFTPTMCLGTGPERHLHVVTLGSMPCGVTSETLVDTPLKTLPILTARYRELPSSGQAWGRCGRP